MSVCLPVRPSVCLPRYLFFHVCVCLSISALFSLSLHLSTSVLPSSISPFRFEIIATTGDIQVKSSLDREKLASYVLNVRANDRGTPSLFSSRLVSIKVKDVNDNSPVFTKSLYSGIIAEDASFGSAVVQVHKIINV